jgi:TolB-like protein
MSSQRGGGKAAIRSLAVLPLENLSGDSAQDYFSDGTTEELISTLARIRSIKVISRASVMRYKGNKRPLPEIGREIGVDAIVTGSLRRAGGRVRIAAQLIYAATDSHLWANEYERDLSDMLRLEAEVSQEIAREIRAQVTAQERTQLAGARMVNPGARDEYLQARHHSVRLNRTDLQQAVEHFERAISLEPVYAEAWAGLSIAHYEQGIWAGIGFKVSEAKARAAGLRAVDLDPNLAEGHAALCLVYSGYDWNWDAAERECRARSIWSQTIRTRIVSTVFY